MSTAYILLLPACAAGALACAAKSQPSGGAISGLRASQAASQQDSVEPLVIDLARVGKNQTDTIPPGRYSVILLNALAGPYVYRIRVTPYAEPIPSLDVPQADTKGAESLCEELQQAVNTLLNAEQEEQVSDLSDAVRRRHQAAAGQTDPLCIQARTAAEDALQNTRRSYPRLVPLKPGQGMRVVVTRVHNHEVERQWSLSFTTGAGGRWSVTYALAGTYSLTRTENWEHFAKQTDNNNQFVLTAKDIRSRVAPVPAVFYSWLPTDQGLQWSVLSAGLGLDFKANPAVFLGTGIVYKGNLALTIGGALRQESNLAGRYHNGDLVSTALGEDQLNSKIWRVQPFASLSFRFKSNPFGGAGEAKPGPKQPVVEPSDTTEATADPRTEQAASTEGG